MDMYGVLSGFQRIHVSTAEPIATDLIGIPYMKSSFSVSNFIFIKLIQFQVLRIPKQDQKQCRVKTFFDAISALFA